MIRIGRMVTDNSVSKSVLIRNICVIRVQKKDLNTDDTDWTDSHGFVCKLSVLIRNICVIRRQAHTSVCKKIG